MTELKNSKGNPRARFNCKKKCWKDVISHRNNNSQHNLTASSDRQNLQSLVRCVEIVVDMRITAHTGPRQANATRTLTGCWLTARRVVVIKLKILIQVVLLGPNWENALKIPVGCCQTASWAACALSATTEWGEIMIWLFIIILTVH